MFCNCAYATSHYVLRNMLIDVCPTLIGSLQGYGMLRVLVVDDEKVIADSLANILGGFGYATTAAYSGMIAVELAGVVMPDVLITDVMMPGITGIQAAIQIREKLPACRVILLSGIAATADLVAEAKYQGHCFDFLPKPVHPKVLLAYLTGSVSSTLGAASPA